MNSKWLFSIVFICGVFVSSVSQVLLKKSAQQHYQNKIREYLNARVIFAYMIFFAATLCSIIAYKVIPLSLGPILGSAGYIFVAFLSRIFLKEKITKRKILGLSVIIIGIVIFSI